MNKVQQAKSSIQQATKLLNAVKPLLQTKTKDNEMAQYAQMYKPLRLQVYKLSGQIYASLRDFEMCEKEFRMAVKDFPKEGAAWEMLARILDLVGKGDEAREA